MRKILYFIVGVIFISSCQHSENLTPMDQGCVLELDVNCVNKKRLAAAYSVDSDLAITILDSNGRTYKYYAAGSVPSKIVLEPGTFVVRAHTENQSTWQTANNGKGEPCYLLEDTVHMEYDSFRRLVMAVPMTNYAVSLELPELFDVLFRDYTFMLVSGNREVSINQGEKAYFDVADGGFSYSLRATNTDGATHSHSPIQYTDVTSGKMFLLRYSYDSDATSGGVDIEITDDMGTDDTIVDL